MSNLAKEIQERETAALTLGDRINFPYVLSKAINKFLDASVQKEGLQSTQEMLEASKGIFDLIPDAWRMKDEQFQKEIRGCILTVQVDNRPYWCGVRVGNPSFQTITIYDPHLLFHACVNLFQRRGLLSRTLYQEIATGEKFNE